MIQSPQGQGNRIPDQPGAALVVMQILLILVSAGVVPSRLDDDAHSRLLDHRDPDLALERGNAYLPEYAVGDTDRPGELPCPDFDYDGQIVPANDLAGTNCRTRWGRLAWLALGMPEPRDGEGQWLWYALSDDFRIIGTPAPPLSSGTPGQLSLGATADVVATAGAIGVPSQPLTVEFPRGF